MIPKLGVRIPNMDEIGYTAKSVSFVIVDIRIVTRKVPMGHLSDNIVLLCHGSKNRKTKRNGTHAWQIGNNHPGRRSCASVVEGCVNRVHSSQTGDRRPNIPSYIGHRDRDLERDESIPPRYADECARRWDVIMDASDCAAVWDSPRPWYGDPWILPDQRQFWMSCAIWRSRDG